MNRNTPTYPPFRQPHLYPPQYPHPQAPSASPSGISPPTPQQQRYIYPPPDALIHQPHTGNNTSFPIFCLTTESADCHRLPEAASPFHPIQSLTETERSDASPSPIACGSAESRDDSPPRRTNTPPELNQLRLQSITELADTFQNFGNTVAFTGHPMDRHSHQSITAIQRELLRHGRELQARLLTQVPPRPPANRPVPHPYLPGQFLDMPSNGQLEMHAPPLFSNNLYQAVAQQTPQHPGTAFTPLVPNSPWDTPPPQGTPGHQGHPPHTPSPPFTQTSLPAPPRTPFVAPAASATTAWALAHRVSDLMTLDPQIPLSALKIIKPLSTCPDRHHMAEVLSNDNLKFFPHALEWLARFDGEKANELGVCALLHFVEVDEIVPSSLTNALLSVLHGAKTWPRDAKDVGLLLGKLKQQPDARFYAATNALIGRLLCPDQ